MDSLIGTTIGGCRIESELGQGGMGAVYKAHHLALDIPVAVKILNNFGDIPNAEERFLREARIAARLKHPNIVSVLNVGCENNIHFIIMEFVQGNSLQKRIGRAGQIKLDEALSIALDILSALQVAYGNGIVHRDIKPENILIDEHGNAKLADLGLARISSDLTITQPNTVLGSPHYVAPEQAENPSSVDCRSDLYALGCTLFHVLSGKTPFSGSTVIEVVMNHINKPVPPLPDTLKEVSEEVREIIRRLMEKKPEDRFQTPEEAIYAIQKVTGKNTKTIMNHTPVSRRELKSKNTFKAFTLQFPVVLFGCAILILLQFPLKQRVQESVLLPGDSTKFSTIPPIADSNELVKAKGIIKDKEKSPRKKQKKESEKSPDSPSSTEKNSLKKAQHKDEPQKTTRSEKARRAHQRADDPVLASVRIGDTEQLSTLLSEGESADGNDNNSSTPLHEAVKRGLTRETEMLLKYGANPNKRDKRGFTPLHYALRDGATLMVKELLKNGADPNMPDKSGRRPLAIAASVDSELEKLIKANGGR